MLSIGNKKYRNLQEQVGFNSEQIEKIFDILDGLAVTDNVVAIADLSDNLNTDQLEIVQKSVAFLVYDGQLYIKKSEDASNAYFDIVFTISVSGDVISFTSKEITVTLATGALGLVSSTNSTYSTTHLDSAIGAKADQTYVDTQLALKANLAGADFTGAVTALTLKQTNANWFGIPINNNTSTATKTVTNIYNRVEVINNILYVVLNVSVTNISGSDIDARDFFSGYVESVPAEIASKIFDLNGKALNETITQNCKITLVNALYCKTLNDLSSNDTPVTTLKLTLYHDYRFNDRLYMLLGNVTSLNLPAGETRYATARLALTLI